MQEICSLSISPIKRSEDDTGPYSLRNFLPAGTLALPVACAEAVHCDSCHSDGWHDWPGYAHLSSTMRAEEHDLLRMIDFLATHKFISATCRLGHQAGLKSRIYLIPWDLAGVEGRLRRRDIQTVLQPARKYLRILLFRITKDDASWAGGFPIDETVPFFHKEIDNRSLAEIFNTLPSPLVRPGTARRHLLSSNEIPGMRSRLYNYQIESVAAMLDRELHPGMTPDPLFVPIHGVVGISGDMTFYWQPATMEVLRDRPSVAQIRGGILCEELGTGKTVMTLALIAVTLDQLPTPEDSILDYRPILTPIALRYFPSEDFADARVKLARGKKKRKHKTTEHQSQIPRIPSLVEHLVHFCRTHPAGLELREYESDLEARSLWRPLQQSAPFYYHYDDPLETQRSSRNKITRGPKRMYLTGATLIVVPPNLYNQWVNEINKHCEDQITSRVYRATNKPLPLASELSSAYDIVLLTHQRFSAESQKTATEKLHSWKVCHCPELPHSSIRVPDCHCRENIEDVSPLLQVRWKRLIIDEGHVAGTTTTNLMAFIRTLSIERQWIVTGTPTTNLMGLHFGEGSELMYPEQGEDLDTKQDAENSVPASVNVDDLPVEDTVDISSLQLQYPVPLGQEETFEHDPDTSFDSTVAPACRNFEERSPSPHAVRVWTKNDREDLYKMGNMITSFLELPAFAADTKLFSAQVIAPLMDSSGPRPGAIQVLTQVMESVMIRHRIEDVEREVLLPILTQETVLLDLDPYSLKTYNVMQAGIILNAVDSERVDQDYFFHPRNTAYLQQLIENISQTMFWHIDDERFNVDEIMEQSANFLKRGAEKVEKGSISRKDYALLKQALKHVEYAAHDPVWRSLMLHPHICHRIYGMPEEIFAAWSILSPSINLITDSQYANPHHLLISDRLRALRSFLARQPLSQTSRIIDWGHLVVDQDEARINLAKRTQANKTGRKGKNINLAAKGDHTAQLMAAQEKLRALMASDQTPEEQGNAMLLASSPLSGVRIGDATSSKLNYILSEVNKYQSEAKFLIFSRSPLTLLYVAEGLALLGIPYKLTSQKPVRMLEQDVTTFESSETFRVFLMELKHGARGLNLVTASRVIFCEPVWQADVESQAIKRVHRIGQTSSVTVKTLAIRGTAEEAMVKRRDDLKRGLGNNSGRLPNLAEDSAMRDFIANPTFLPESPSHPPSLDFPYLPQYDGPMPPPAPFMSVGTGVHGEPRLVLRIPGLNSPKRAGSSARFATPPLTGTNTNADADRMSMSISPGKRVHAVINGADAQADTDDVTHAYVGSPPPSKKRKSGPSVRFADLP